MLGLYVLASQPLGSMGVVASGNTGAGVIAGQSTVSGAAQSVVSVAGTVTASASITGVAQALVTSAGTIAGTATLSPVAKAVASAVGVINGQSVVTAGGNSITNIGTGTVTGVSTVAAAGASTVSVVGTVTASSSAVVTGGATIAVAGTINGVATVSAVGNRIQLASGQALIAGSSIVLGSGRGTYLTLQLNIYNDACLLAGVRSLTSLYENVEARYVLDQVWNSSAVDLCLSEAQWEFALRNVRVTPDPDVEPLFGYVRAFKKPSDWIRTGAVCCDEFYRVPETLYADEEDYWYSDSSEIYVRYISNDRAYGGNLPLWPRSFTEFVIAHFATKLVLKITNDDARRKLFDNPKNQRHTIRGRALTKAKSLCALAQPTMFVAQGAWTRSRPHGVSRTYGGSSNLIGG